MISKKMLVWTLVGIVCSFLYSWIIQLPPEIIKPVLIGLGIIVVVLVYLYANGYLTEEKIVEKIVEHEEDPLSRMHKNPEHQGMFRTEQKAIEDTATSTDEQ